MITIKKPIRQTSFKTSFLMPLGILGALTCNAQLFAEEQNLPADQSLMDLSLEELMSVKVKTATKSEQKLTDTPAIVSVITQQDIHAWGYDSVAQALTQVPGFYGVDDYVNNNFGVRGINGGQRAYSRILKVMINGISSSFRSDSTNFLGKEFIPMSAVDRIEVVRGPGSALYGENAFLGVINIITKKPNNKPQKVALSFGQNDLLGSALDLNYQADDWQVNLAASIAREQQDQLGLPSSSPRFNEFTGKVSQQSDDKPESLFASFSMQSSEIEQNLYLSYSHLDVVAEFLDFGTLSHENRVSLNKSLLAYQLDWQVTPADNLIFNLSASQGGPSSEERLSLSSSTSYPKRAFAFDGLNFSTEYHFNTTSNNSLIAGLDYSSDRESTIEIGNIDVATRDETLISSPSERKTLTNLGIYFQYITPISDNNALTMNLRTDEHNIYGSNTNYRLGMVTQYSDSLSSKFLLGSSYKAPAALQLYSEPLYPGEVIGNLDLLPEEAITFESQLIWRINQQLAFNLNVWATEVENKVELLPTGPNVQPQNAGKQRGNGAESEIKWVNGNNLVTAHIAYSNMKDRIETLFEGVQVSSTAMYPKLTTMLSYQYQLTNQSQLSIVGHYISERRATNSNIRENLLKPYQLEDYQLVNLSYNLSLKPWTVNIKINNLLDQEYAEPGFQGIDIPGKPRRWNLNFAYEW